MITDVDVKRTQGGDKSCTYKVVLECEEQPDPYSFVIFSPGMPDNETDFISRRIADEYASLLARITPPAPPEPVDIPIDVEDLNEYVEE